LMTYFTGGKPYKRKAILAINLQGGSGLEIWQYVNRKPSASLSELQLGDYGIFFAKIKCKNIHTTYTSYQKKGYELKSPVHEEGGRKYFFVQDPFKNIFQVLESTEFYIKEDFETGGVCGVQIGVSDMKNALFFYATLLGYDQVVDDQKKVFHEYASLPGGNHMIHRVILRRNKQTIGAFSALLGSSEIELIQVLDRKALKIYQNRFWGDLGFIHVCFDVKRMPEFGKYMASSGFPLLVDSMQSFSMGGAAGHFSYTEDPDGTLIEFVETHKIPVLKKLGLYLNLNNKRNSKPLPKWMWRLLGLTKVK
jgi:catechol 2,3-dioxygenase-like lactoylglutathione lyase family enzyme